MPHTRHCHPNEVIHWSFQGNLLCHPRMLYTTYKTWWHRESKETIQWTDDLRAFYKVQTALPSAQTISLPIQSDQLWIVTDGVLFKPGIAAILYVTCTDKLRRAEFSSTKLCDSQLTWLPCEVEALRIAVTTKHFSPYLIQSHHKACILSNSKPCGQGYEKLCRGKFSASPHIFTFLSTVSHYWASVRHVSGSVILRSDLAIRNAAPCEDEACQVCTFIRLTQDSVIRCKSIQNILSGNGHLLFTSCTAWLATQLKCPDTCHTHTHLLQGTRPSKKLTNMKDVKRYLNVTSIAKDGLLIVQHNDPIVTTWECIVARRQILEWFLTTLHIQLSLVINTRLSQNATSMPLQGSHTFSAQKFKDFPRTLQDPT